MGVQPDDLQVARLLKPVHRILGFLYPVVMPPDCGCRQEHVHQGGVAQGFVPLRVVDAQPVPASGGR